MARWRKRSTEADTPRGPNILDRQFHASHPNREWIADFTYIWTAKGWLYVAAVIDLFSRHLVGWSVSAAMESFSSSLKNERPDRKVYRSRNQARADVSTSSSASTMQNAGIRQLDIKPY